MAADVPNRFEDEVKDFRAQQQEENHKDAYWLSKLALLSTGLHVFGKSVGRNYFADIMDKAGQGARYLSRIGRKADPEFNPETADFLYSKLKIDKDAGREAFIRGFGGARIGDLDRVKDLAELMSLESASGFEADAKAVYELAKKEFQNLPRSSGKATPSTFHHDLQPLTFGELVDRNNNFIRDAAGLEFGALKGEGKQQSLSIGIIEEALSQQLIHTDTIVDANLFKTMDGRVVDLRMAKPGFALKQTSQAFDIAGVLKSFSSFFSSGRIFSQISPDKDRSAKFFIAGDTYKAAGTGSPIKVATNQTLSEVAGKRFKPAMLREAHRAGDIGSLYVPPKEGGGILGAIQEKTGVGTRFADKRGFGVPFLKALLRNVQGVASGDAKLYARDYVPATDTLGVRALHNVAPELSDIADTGELIKGKYHKRGFMKSGEVSWWDRVKAYAGINKDLIILDKSAETAADISKDHIYTKFNTSGLGSLEHSMGLRSSMEPATGVDMIGQKTYHKRADLFATSAGGYDRLTDFGNYMTIRLNALASSTGIGIGFRPSGSFLANTARLAAIPAAAMALKEGIDYANYEIGEMTGVRPLDAAATLYTKARVLQQQIREKTGVQQAAEYSENSLFPGLSTGFVGTLASLAVGLKTLGMTGSVGKAVAAGGAAYATIGGPDPSQSSEELEAEYSGEKKVAIRKARWWALGYQPFTGGEIDHFAPSWYRKLIDRPGAENIYGGEGEYFRNVSMLPTPRNLFGLKPLLDPYWLEQKNYYRRPYPQTGKLFEEVPIFGPILADTLGEAIKPGKKMHAQQQSNLVANANITERGVPENIASQFGIPGLPNALIDVNRPDVLADRVKKWGNVALEPTGIWKFVLGYFGVKLDDGHKLAEASNMSSIGRSFYDLSLGGLGGQTEFIRRFLMSEYSTPNKINEQINPIANAMPRWLPGSLSEEETDRSYYTDFTRGDAYTKILGGEYRLPGAGYEAVNRLHSGRSGVYDEVDKLMVLADVAPNSTAFFKAKAGLQNVELSPYWQQKVDTALAQREEKLDVYGFNSQQIVAAANLNPISRSIRGAWDASYGMASEIPLVGSKLFPRRNPLDHYIKHQVEGETYANWNNPYETIVRPAMYDVAGSNPVGGVLKGAMLGSLLAAPGAQWLNPMAFTARSMAANAAVGGVAGGIMSTGRMIGTGSLSGGFIPPHIREERDVNEYFDYLKYAKYQGLAEHAKAQGMEREAQSFEDIANRTQVFGLAKLQSTGDMSAYTRSLNKRDRSYFSAFQSAASGRESIMSYVPSHMAEALRGSYGSSGGQAGSPVDIAKQRTAEYFASHTIPDDSSAMWHPQVPMNAVKLRSVTNGIDGLSDSAHRMGFFPSQVREVNARFPFIEPIDSISDLGIANQASKVMNVFGDYVPFGNIKGLNFGYGPEIEYSNSDIYDTRREDVFSFFTAQYR